MMKKIIILSLFIIVLIANSPTALCSSTTAPIVYVDTDGSGDFNCDGTDDHIEINDAINYVADYNDFTTVYLNGPNTYWIDESIYLRNNMIFEGDSDAVVKLVDNANWERKDYGLIDVKGIVPDGDGVDNVTIRGFKIDGNRENQLERTGRGYYNAIKLRRGWNVNIYDMYICNNLGDGVLIDHSKVETDPVNISLHDNVIYEVGHDGFYIKRLSNLTIYNNTITCNVNAGIRTHDTNNVTIYSNTINSNNHGGAGISIGKSDSNLVDNVEIYNNTIYETALWGILLASRGTSTPATSNGVHIYNNLIFGTGTGTSYGDQRTAGICVYGFNNTIIESNTLDFNHKCAISSAIDGNIPNTGTGFVTIVRNNIITESCNYAYDVETTGYGIYNELPNTHSFVVNYNCFYNNDNDDFKSARSSVGNIHSDPKFVRWEYNLVTEKWSDYHLQSTSPCIDAGHPNSDYSYEPEPNGDRINIGRYGNTAEASMSVSRLYNLFWKYHTCLYSLRNT